MKTSKDKKAISYFDLLFGNKNLLKSKRSQIGSTITWFVGFLIIFFVMILFLSATIILSGLRGGSKNTPEEYSYQAIELQRDLIKSLNTPVEFQGEKISIKELIKKWDVSESEGRKNIEKALQQGFNQALPSYSVTIRGIDHDVLLSLENNPGKSSRISEDEFSSVYLVSDKGMLMIILSFNKYEGVPI